MFITSNNNNNNNNNIFTDNKIKHNFLPEDRLGNIEEKQKCMLDKLKNLVANLESN